MDTSPRIHVVEIIFPIRIDVESCGNPVSWHMVDSLGAPAVPICQAFLGEGSPTK